MLTLPVNFERYRKHLNSEPIFALVIYGQGQNFYLSDRPLTLLDWMGESNITFQPLVESWGNMKHSINPFNKESAVASCKITLINTPFRRITAGMQCASDYLSATRIINRTAEIWMGFSQLTCLYDYVKVFTGVVQMPKDASTKTMALDLYDATFQKHKNIPANYINETDYPGAPIAEYNRRLPLPYGGFSLDNDLKGNIAHGIWLDSQKICFADHIIGSIDAVWLWDETLNRLAKIDPAFYTINLADDGRATVTITHLSDREDFGNATQPLGKEDLGAASGGGANYLDDSTKSWATGEWMGREIEILWGTGAGQHRTITTNTATRITVGSNWTTQPDNTSHYRMYWGNHPSNYLEDSSKSWKANEWAGFTIEITNGIGGGQTRTITSNTSNRVYVDSDWSTSPDNSSSYEIYRAGYRNEADVYIWPSRMEYTNSPYFPTFPFKTWSNNTYDQDRYTGSNARMPEKPPVGSWDVIGDCYWYFEMFTQEAGKILNIYLQAAYNLKYAFPTTPNLHYGGIGFDINFTNEPAAGAYHDSAGTGVGLTWAGIEDNSIHLPFNFLIGPEGSPERDCLDFFEVRLRIRYMPVIKSGMKIFCECQGRLYGSWIDATGRSNSYNAGAVIKNPAFIIETILREQLGYTTTNIDVASFDKAGSNLGTWDFAVSLQELENTKAIIERICRQSKMNFFFDSQGLATLKIIDITSPTEDDTLTKDQVEIDTLKLDQGDINYLVNRFNLNYNFWPAYDNYRNSLSVDNAASQTNYNGIFEKSLSAESVPTLAVATLIADHFVGANGFWKDPRHILSLDMASLEKIHWEIGDLIKPDTTFNTLYQLFGVDWGTAIFMIITKVISSDKLAFEMIKVN